MTTQSAKGPVEYGCSDLSDIMKRHPGVIDEIYRRNKIPAMNITSKGELYALQIGEMAGRRFIPLYSTPLGVLPLGTSPEQMIETEAKTLGALIGVHVLAEGTPIEMEVRE